MQVAQYVEGLTEIISKGGPEISEYDYLKKVPEGMATISVEDQLKVHDILAPLLTTESMIGFTFQKPHGYAGDFELIDRIYSQRKSKDKNLNKWDSFYHNLEAASAVRNRKKYFKNLMDKVELEHEGGRVLNLGSGPCTDLFEYLKRKSKHNIKLKFECLDMDPVAIEYGSSVCDNYIDNISFINKNVFRFKPDYKYEIIWSAGLFDYFNDKLFIRLLKRTYGLVTSGGELVIGNFSTYNPSRAVMEVFGQWYLYHRNEEKLIELALLAGIPEKLIEVRQEDEGVNLFLHVKKL